MPDIDPSALSRPAGGLSTPVLASKTITSQAPGSLKAPKTSQIIPSRIDLEPLYAVLKSAVGIEQWAAYKVAIAEFMLGRLNQAEYQERIDSILNTPEKEHMHNQLLAALYGNVTREMPDPDLAPWVSTNDKPAAPPAPKPVTGDAAERRLKGEVMQLPNRDRRRIKDLVHNNYDPHETLATAFADPSRRPSRLADATPQTGSMSTMNLDLEIRKRFTQPLAVESGEFPDVGAIEGRMLPICYENGLTNGHTTDAAQLVSLATETFIKDALSGVFSRVRCNAPGEGGMANYGMGTTWVQTHRYKRQLAREENAALRGEISRDKGGFLPVEAKAASDRGPLSMTDLRIAIDIADFGLAQFPAIRAAIINDYREGELENWTDYTWLPGREPAYAAGDVEEVHIGPITAAGITAGGQHGAVDGAADAMDVDSDLLWEGGETQDLLGLDNILDSCLAA